MVGTESRNCAYVHMFQMFALFQLNFAVFAFSDRRSNFQMWRFEQHWNWDDDFFAAKQYIYMLTLSHFVSLSFSLELDVWDGKQIKRK